MHKHLSSLSLLFPAEAHLQLEARLGCQGTFQRIGTYSHIFGRGKSRFSSYQGIIYIYSNVQILYVQHKSILKSYLFLPQYLKQAWVWIYLYWNLEQMCLDVTFIMKKVIRAFLQVEGKRTYAYWTAVKCSIVFSFKTCYNPVSCRAPSYRWGNWCSVYIIFPKVIEYSVLFNWT